MADPLVAEFCRSTQLDPSFLRRCQREFRTRVQTQLDEREALLAENASLKAQVAALMAAKPRRGRPRKVEEGAPA